MGYETQKAAQVKAVESTMNKAAHGSGFAYAKFLLDNFAKCPWILLEKWSGEEDKFVQELLNQVGLTNFSTKDVEPNPITQIFADFLKISVRDDRKDHAYNHNNTVILPGQIARLVFARFLELSRMPTLPTATEEYSQLERDIASFLQLPLVHVNTEALKQFLEILSNVAADAVIVNADTGKHIPSHCAMGVSNIFLHSQIFQDPKCKIVQAPADVFELEAYKRLEQGLRDYLQKIDTQPSAKLQRMALFASWGKLIIDGKPTAFAKMLNEVFSKPDKDGKTEKDKIKAVLQNEYGLTNREFAGGIDSWLTDVSLKDLSVPFDYQLEAFQGRCKVHYPKLYAKLQEITLMLKEMPEDKRPHFKDYQNRLDVLNERLCKYDAYSCLTRSTIPITPDQ
jgi:hypothetical protein